MATHHVSGFIAGGQIGFNWQVANWVLGIEGQASWSNADGEHEFSPFALRTEVEWLSTVAGRLGYAFDRVLVYAKGGAAFVHDKHRATFIELTPSGFPSFSGDKTRSGWIVGGGVEVAVGGNWSVKAEYNYMDFGKERVTLGPLIFDIDQQIQVVKFGVNYRFGAAAPVVARY
jgi:outer membrane immunogenic protein